MKRIKIQIKSVKGSTLICNRWSDLDIIKMLMLASWKRGHGTDEEYIKLWKDEGFKYPFSHQKSKRS